MTEEKSSIDLMDSLGYSAKEDRKKWNVELAGEQFELGPRMFRLMNSLMKVGSGVFSDHQLFKIQTTEKESLSGSGSGTNVRTFKSKMDEMFGTDILFSRGVLPEDHPDRKGKRVKGWNWTPENLLKD